ncbi:MAG: CubicO group peptidase (beta-lactamase class C family) [Arenicella sp.]|jgi:CubicO group peptidase (beta-lactamase class C family)
MHNLTVKTVIFTALFICLSVPFSAKAKDADNKKVVISKAEKVGMSSERLQRLESLGQRYVADGNYAGLVTLVARKGKIVHFKAHGNVGIDNQTPMETDTLFRIYSMTKPVTAVAAMMLYEEGKFHMNDPVSKYLPAFAGQKVLVNGELVTPDSPMRMRQLFMHTAGLSYGFGNDNAVDIEYQKAQLFQANDLDDFIAKLAKLPLRYQPGERYHYSVSMDVLGAVIEKLADMPLDEFFSQRIFQPLKMNDTFFELPANKKQRLASDQYWDAQANTIAVMPAERSRSYDDVGLFMGGGGLISTAYDYFRFSQMVLNGGELDGARLLGPKTVAFLGSNHMTEDVRAVGKHDLHAGQSMALGYGVVTDPALMPATSSMGELSWAGLAGTKFWIDPQEQLIGIGLVQLYSSPWPLRFDLKVGAYQAITELNSQTKQPN